MATGLMSALLVISAAVLGLLSVPAAAAGATNVLYSGDQKGSTLLSGESLILGSYELRMQMDCNLALYDGDELVWETGTARKIRGGCRLSLLSDGNLVIYNRRSEVMWSSGSSKEEGYYVLVLQRDRNLVVYGPPIWATGSNAQGSKTFIVRAGRNDQESASDAAVLRSVVSN